MGRLFAMSPFPGRGSVGRAYFSSQQCHRIDSCCLAPLDTIFSWPGAVVQDSRVDTPLKHKPLHPPRSIRAGRPQVRFFPFGAVQIDLDRDVHPGRLKAEGRWVAPVADSIHERVSSKPTARP